MGSVLAYWVIWKSLRRTGINYFLFYRDSILFLQDSISLLVIGLLKLSIYSSFNFCGLYGEGNDNPFKHSCLENPMDRGAYWATVHGVAKSWTQLSDLTSVHVSRNLFPLGCSIWWHIIVHSSGFEYFCSMLFFLLFNLLLCLSGSSLFSSW